MTLHIRDADECRMCIASRDGAARAVTRTRRRAVVSATSVKIRAAENKESFTQSIRHPAPGDLFEIVQLLDDRARFAEDPQRREALERTHVRLHELLSRLAGQTHDENIRTDG